MSVLQRNGALLLFLMHVFLKKKYNCIFELSVQFDKLSQRGFEVVMIQTGRTNLLGPTREKL